MYIVGLEYHCLWLRSENVNHHTSQCSMASTRAWRELPAASYDTTAIAFGLAEGVFDHANMSSMSVHQAREHYSFYCGSTNDSYHEATLAQVLLQLQWFVGGSLL